MNQSLLKNLAHENDTVLSKRRFLKTMACGSLMAMGLPKITKASTWNLPLNRAVALENVHTGDKLKLTYFEDGRYIREAMHEISYALRDYHTDDVYPIDPALIDQLYDLKNTLGISKPFHIVSGYRCPSTNAHLRHAARHSLHMEGRAIDIKIEGLHTRNIRDAALSLRSGGVGYYPYESFVHLDTGEIRTWTK
jgi:uncharacterized protein YcbK (DUF882 family)